MAKTLILHDTFLYRGGGERLVLLMAKALNADIASGFFSPGSYNLREQGFNGKMITLMPSLFLHEFTWLPKKIAFVFKNGLRHFGLKWAFSIKTRHLADSYDTVILSGDCLPALHHFSRKKVIYYCHTIPRYLFDQREEYEKKVPKFMLYIYQFMISRFKRAYLRDLDMVKILLTNSENTKKRIRFYTGKESQILYPPVDTGFFCPHNGEKGKYFLSFARLSSIKRVDRIVRAFQELPDQKLVITYGANDPEKNAIMSMIQGYDNISMKLSPSDIELRDLIRGTRATIYVPVDEDFGMSPVESMACGTPVIGVNDGGLKESIIDGETGILIDKECSYLEIKKAVLDITVKDLDTQTCVQQALKFSLIHFTELLKKIINTN